MKSLPYLSLATLLLVSLLPVAHAEPCHKHCNECCPANAPCCPTPNCTKVCSDCCKSEESCCSYKKSKCSSSVALERGGKKASAYGDKGVIRRY